MWKKYLDKYYYLKVYHNYDSNIFGVSIIEKWGLTAI